MTTEERKTKVDVGHLIRVVIPKQYRFDIHIASLIELVANALDASRLDLHPNLRDAGASSIEISIDRGRGVLEVTDYGVGMGKEQLEKYHDIESTKVTGKEIGFAGQGAKLALNFCSKVVTETISPSYKGYSEWRLDGKEAPYQPYDNQTLSLNHRGTKVTLYLDDDSKSFYTSDLIEQILKEHYYPLLDDQLLEVYTGKSAVLIDEKRSLTVKKPIYDEGLKFIVNGKQIVPQPLQGMLEKSKDVSITVFTKAKARGFFGLAKDGLEESLRGIAICSFGKVIDRTWFRKEPPEKQRIAGWIEAPYLIEAVTTDKCGFQRGNKTWEGFFRKAQAEFAKWLEEIGLSERPVERKADFSNLEREINSILRNFPELTFFGSRIQRDVAIPDEAGEQRALGEGTQKVPGTKGGVTKGGGTSVYPGDEPGVAPTLDLGSGTAATPHQRIIRGGIQLMPEEKPDLDKEARCEGKTVFINVLHPAYKRAEREKVLNYHLVKSVALSLIEFNLENDPEPSYQKAFELSQRFFKLWGEQ